MQYTEQESGSLEELFDLVKDFHDDLEYVRIHGEGSLFLPDSIEDFNKRYKRDAKSFAEVKEELYQELILEKGLNDSKKVRLLALINPDRLWSDINENQIDLNVSRTELISSILTADIFLLTEENYWNQLSQNEKTVVVSEISETRPGDFLEKGEIFENVRGFDLLVQKAILKINPEEFVFRFAEDPISFRYISKYSHKELENKIFSIINVDYLENINEKWEVNPYLYIEKIHEGGDEDTGMRLRDVVLTKCCEIVELDIDELYREIIESTDIDEYADYSDEALMKVADYLNKKLPYLNSDYDRASIDRRLMETYIYSLLEQKDSYGGGIVLRALQNPKIMPPLFINRVLALDISISQLNTLVMCQNLNTNDLVISQRLEELAGKYVTKYKTADVGDVVDWDILVFVLKNGNENNKRDLLNLITPEEYYELLLPTYSELLRTSRNFLIENVDDTTKLSYYENLSNEKKLQMLIMDRFNDQSMLKKIYEELTIQISFKMLAYDDFLFVRKDMLLDDDQQVQKRVLFYLEVGRETYQIIKERFRSVDFLFGKSKEECLEFIKRSNGFLKPVEQLMTHRNLLWLSENVQTVDIQNLNKAWLEIVKDPWILKELSKLSYISGAIKAGHWNKPSSKSSVNDVVREMANKGINSLHKEIANMSVEELNIWLHKTAGIGRLAKGFLVASPDDINLIKASKEVKITVIQDRLTAFSELVEEFLLFRYMNHRMKMNNEKIDNYISILSADIDANHFIGKEGSYLIDLLSLGLIGKNGEFILKNLEEIKTILEQGVTYKGNLLDFFDVIHPEKSLELLRKNGGKYITDIKESERLVEVLVDRVLSNKSELFLHNRFQPKDVVLEEYKTKQRRSLRSAFEFDIKDVREAETRNIAAVISQDWTPQIGDLLHIISYNDMLILDIVKSQNNFPKEYLNQVIDSNDSYPGYVDLQEIDEQILLQLTEKIVGKQVLFGGQDRVKIVYWPAGLDVDSADKNSEHYNHKLVPGAISFLQMKAIILTEDFEKESLIELKSLIVKSGVYVPLYSQFGGKLLFEVSEYLDLKESTRVLESLEELSQNDAIFADLESLKNTGEDTSILKHLNDVRDDAVETGKEMGISPEYLDILRSAAKLHDTGKKIEGLQEINNVAEAEKYLQLVVGLDVEKKKQILLLIRNDELLGEIFQEFDIDSDTRTPMFEKKWKMFNSIFAHDEQLKKCMIALYLADVRSYGNKIMNSHNKIMEKLKLLGLI